jgi:hypothetical protein
MKTIARIAVTAMLYLRKPAAFATSLLCLVIVTGCGSSGSDSSSSPHYTSAKQVATALKCTYWAPQYVEEGAADSGACQLGGDQVVVAWFKSAKVAKAYYAKHPVVFDASYADSYLFGTNWALKCTHTSTCSAARKALGSGKLVGTEKNS